MRRFYALAFSAALLVNACSSAAPQSTPVGTPAATVAESARNTAFEQLQLDVPSNQTFAIDFTNYDTAPHNIKINSTSGVRAGEIFSGPGQRTYVFAGLEAGTYQFVCEVHPQMTGSLVVT